MTLVDIEIYLGPNLRENKTKSIMAYNELVSKVTEANLSLGLELFDENCDKIFYGIREINAQKVLAIANGIDGICAKIKYRKK